MSLEASRDSTHWELIRTSEAEAGSVTFTATAVLNRTLVIVSGNAQVAAPGAPLPNPLVVHAQDNGANVAGVGINWTVLSGTASVTPAR